MRSDTVVLDNLTAHKVSGIRQRIEAAGARLLYPQVYSPEFISIVLTYPRLTVFLRTTAARTISDFSGDIRRRLDCFTPAGCRAYLATVGCKAT